MDTRSRYGPEDEQKRALEPATDPARLQRHGGSDSCRRLQLHLVEPNMCDFVREHPAAVAYVSATAPLPAGVRALVVTP